MLMALFCYDPLFNLSFGHKSKSRWLYVVDLPLITLGLVGPLSC